MSVQREESYDFFFKSKRNQLILQCDTKEHNELNLKRNGLLEFIQVKNNVEHYT